MADENSNDQGEHDQLGEGESIKGLRDAARRSKDNADKASKLEREMAFAKVVGIDKVDHPLVQNLMGAYTGDLTKEAVTAHLDSMQVTNLLGLGAGATTTTEGHQGDQGDPNANANAGGGQAGDRSAAIDGGGTASEGTTKHPAQAGLEAAFDLMEQGATREDASTAFFSSLFKAAAEGDKRVLTEANRESAAPVGS